MPIDDSCPRCGAGCPPDSPEGLCPECLLRLAWASDFSTPAGDVRSSGGPSGQGRGLTASAATTNGRGALETLTEIVGSIPRVLLRDTDLITGAGPVVRPTSSEMPDPGERAGRLQLLGEIARGGMGAVLKGRDNDLGRDLAVKVLLERHGKNPELLRRFVEEAQIAGQLQHPGVVPVYEMGTFADRRPYFAMKLVKGRTLAEVMAARPDPSSDHPRLLAIFLDVAQTMAYAHARGVIHRDLKPSNVMVGSFGEVQVMDWGLAKVLPRGGVVDDRSAGKLEFHETVIATARSGSGSGLSVAGSILGTPSYMAPEQARGENDRLDERADVFALGSILCEILTGEPAFIGWTSGEIQRKAGLGDLADALTRLDDCSADTDLIAVAKACLGLVPEDRPRGAGDVAKQVTAYMTGVQEKLRRAELDSVEERGRHRLTMVAAAAIIVLGLAAGGGYIWNQNQKAERLARTARVVDEALADAVRLRGAAQSAPPSETADWTEALSAAKRAEGLLAQGEADATLRRRVAVLLAELHRERAAAAEKAALLAVDRSLLANLESIRGHLAERLDPKKTDADFAAAFRTAGLDLDAIGSAESGRWLLARSEPVELASYLDGWAFLRRRVERTEADWRRLVAASRVADPNPWRDALRAKVGAIDAGAVAEFRRLADDEKALELQPATSLILLALQLKDGAGDRVRAARVLRQAVSRNPAEFWAQFELGNVHGIDSGPVGEIYPRPEESVRHLTAAVAIRPNSPTAHSSLGNALQAQGKLDEAVAEHRETIRLRPNSADAYNNLGNVLKVQGKLDEAVAAYREAVRLGPDLAYTHGNLGYALDQVGGRRVEAITAWREAVRLDPNWGATWYWLGRSLILEGDFEGSAYTMRRAQLLLPPGGNHTVPDPAGHLARAERYIALKKRLPGVLRGDDKPSPAERIEFARMCFGLSLFATSARFAKQAYEEAPELLEDVAIGRRYFVGVCASARAGCGEGKDDPAPTEAERTQFREQALLWFREELASWKRRFAIGPPSSSMLVRDALETARRKDVALSSFRDPERLAKLPEAEQTAWRAIWSEVDALHVEWQTLVKDMDAALAADLERRFPALLRNEERPVDQPERLRLAELCYRRKLYAASARFYGEALKHDTLLSERPASPDRYKAGCSAALAGCGQGKDEPPTGYDARAKLRQVALDWLKAERDTLAKQLDADVKGQAKVGQTFQQWQQDTDLACIRDHAALAKLSERERDEWQAFWDEVDALILKAQAKRPN